MVQYEGQGNVSPAPVPVQITGEELRFLIDVARERHTAKYANRKDEWGRGLISGGIIEGFGELPASIMAILVGTVGEYALKMHIHNCIPSARPQIDLSVFDGGDGGVDLDVFGYRMQVKSRKRDYAEMLIRASSERGWRKTLVADGFIQTQWVQRLRPQLIGWAERDTVINWTEKKAYRGNHTNYVGGDNDLLPMSRLISKLAALGELQ